MGARRPLFFSVLLLLPSACQDGQRTKQEKRQDFSNLLNQGRGVRHTALAPSSRGFFLGGDDGVIVHAERDVESDALSWVKYNTEKMPDVKENDLESYTLAFVAEQDSDFKVNTSELQRIPGSIRLTPQIEQISFRRAVQGMQLRDAYLDAVFSKRTEDGSPVFRLREIVNRTAE